MYKESFNFKWKIIIICLIKRFYWIFYEWFLMLLIFVIEEGKSFGEVVLMLEDFVCNVIVIVDEEIDLLVISWELFNRFMKV